jgi:hypothetical protein
VAGINAGQAGRTIELDLSFIGNRKGALITDAAGPREFSQGSLETGKVRVALKPRGGFVAVFR